MKRQAKEIQANLHTSKLIKEALKRGIPVIDIKLDGTKIVMFNLDQYTPKEQEILYKIIFQRKGGGFDSYRV